MVPGHQVHVDVEDRLPARRPVGLEQGHAVRSQALPQQRGDVMDRLHQARGVLAADVPDVRGMTAGNDERVPGDGGRAVEDRDGVRVT